MFVDPEVLAAKSCGPNCLPKLSVFSVEVDVPNVVRVNSKGDDWCAGILSKSHFISMAPL